MQKGMLGRVENFNIESKAKRGFGKGDMHVVITTESTTIVSLIPTFQPKLIPIFFTWISLKNSKIIFKIGGLLPLLSSSLV